MRRKDFYIVGDKKYKIGELTVGLYWLFLIDSEQFLEELFLEFNKDIPKLTEEQIEVLYEELFDLEEEKLFDIILDDKKLKQDTDKIEDFHIVIGKFMILFPGNSFPDVMKIPIKIFNKLLEDSKIITGEEKYKKNRVKSGKTEKRKLKQLFNNQKLG